MSSFLAINAKGEESISPKQKNRTTTQILKEVFKLVSQCVFKRGESFLVFSKISKTLLNTKGRISFRGSFV
jgi:hypothetical protein